MQRLSRILIADDNDDIRKLLRITLNNPAVQLMEASNGKDAFELIKRNNPELVLLDIMMPGEIDGLDVCRKIKSDPGLMDTKVILVTSRAQQTDIQEGNQAGADVYLIKPFSPLQLIDTLKTMIPSATGSSRQM